MECGVFSGSFRVPNGAADEKMVCYDSLPLQIFDLSPKLSCLTFSLLDFLPSIKFCDPETLGETITGPILPLLNYLLRRPGDSPLGPPDVGLGHGERVQHSVVLKGLENLSISRLLKIIK